MWNRQTKPCTYAESTTASILPPLKYDYRHHRREGHVQMLMTCKPSNPNLKFFPFLSQRLRLDKLSHFTIQKYDRQQQGLKE